MRQQGRLSQRGLDLLESLRLPADLLDGGLTLQCLVQQLHNVGGPDDETVVKGHHPEEHTEQPDHVRARESRDSFNLRRQGCRPALGDAVPKEELIINPCWLSLVKRARRWDRCSSSEVLATSMSSR